LEIGFGTGLNLPNYPSHVRRIVTVDPNPGTRRRAQKRIQETGIQVDQHVLSSERLPFSDGTFACVVSTFTMCSIDQIDQAVAEIYRVLKQSGRLLFLEHGLSPEPNVQKWQNRLNWLQMKIGDGCRLNRNMREIVSTVPFQSVDASEFYAPKTPKTHGYLYRGIATK
jgi:ubiquinone/menaquinone biosynthesis C-methylase UbiE